MMTEDGKQITYSDWKCVAVKSLADANQAHSGWQSNNFDDSAWNSSPVVIK